ncbi:MAG: response regulator [Pseudomonadota bacterium]
MSYFRILLVEDNPDHAQLITDALRNEDPTVLVTHLASGQAALNLLAASQQGEEPKPHLIVMDVNMPGLTGIEVLSRIKRDDTLRVIPTVMLSTSTKESDILSALTAHANSYAVKSSDFDAMERDLGSICSYWRISHHPPGEAA